MPLPEKSSVTKTSVAITNLTPLSAAFFSIAFATSNWSSSQIELPILPPLALTKVYAIPPPIIRLSTLSIKFSKTPIFDETFAPPTTAVKGLVGLSSACDKHLISFSINKPETAGDKSFATFAVEVWFL